MKRFLGLFFAGVVVAGSAFAQVAGPIRPIGRISNPVLVNRLITERILQPDQVPYSRVNVSETDIASGKMLNVRLFRGDMWLFEDATIQLNAANQVVNVARNLAIARDRIVFNPCPDDTVRAVFATPADWIPSAVTAVQESCNEANSHQLKCVALVGAQASVLNYKRYLACPKLVVFGNVGHGNTGGIALADGSLSHTYFDALSDTALNNKVLYFNSCQVHNNPLENAVMSAGTRTYIGGVTNLGIGTSEEVFKCFWNEVLPFPGGDRMGGALTQCENDHYPATGAHGIRGDTNELRRMIIIRPTPLPIPTRIPVPFPTRIPIPVPGR